MVPLLIILPGVTRRIQLYLPAETFELLQEYG